MASRSSSDAMAYAARALAPARPPPRADPRRESCSAVFGLLCALALRQVVRPPARSVHRPYVNQRDPRRTVRHERLLANKGRLPLLHPQRCRLARPHGHDADRAALALGSTLYRGSTLAPVSLPTPVKGRCPLGALVGRRGRLHVAARAAQPFPLSVGAVCVRWNTSQFPYNVCNAHQPLDHRRFT